MNGSGTAFNHAKLQLVAGDLNRVRQGVDRMEIDVMRKNMAAAAPRHGWSQAPIVEMLIPSIVDVKLIDEVVQVSSEDAFAMAKRLIKEEGILCGISSGAAVVATAALSSRHFPLCSRRHRMNAPTMVSPHRPSQPPNAPNPARKPSSHARGGVMIHAVTTPKCARATSTN